MIWINVILGFIGFDLILKVFVIYKVYGWLDWIIGIVLLFFSCIFFNVKDGFFVV